MSTIRIKDQTTDTALQAGDYVIVDSASEGTRKFDLGSALSGGSGSGLTDAEKSLILTLFNQAAYTENDAGTAYNQLSNLWSGYSITWSGSGFTHSNNSSSITGGSTFTSTVSASSGFTITGVVATMGGNTVQGAWQNGTVTIPNVTGNIVITVTTVQATVSSISALYTQSGTVYDTDSLDSLKSDLVVTATYVDQSTYTVPSAEYTLSGTLTAGTSTITVSYGGKTTTFTVTVTHQDSRTKLYDWDFTTGLVDSVQGTTAELSENVTRDSAGVHIPEGKNIVKLANVTLNQYTIEIDVTSATHTNTTEYNLFCTAQENYAGSRCGLWHSSYWGYRLSNNANATNAMENNTNIALFNGKTMKAKIDYTNQSIKVYADDVLVCDFNNHTTPNGRTYVGLGSTYNGSVGSVITACRIYEGVD